MLEVCLIGMIGRDLINSRKVSISEDESVLMIDTDKGSLSIMPLGNENYRVLYNPPIFEENENWKDVFDGGNQILTDYYEEAINYYNNIKPKIEAEGYSYIPSFQKDLPYEDALDVSLYILLKILPMEHNLSRNLN